MDRRKVLTENQLFQLLNDFSDLEDESDGDEVESIGVNLGRNHQEEDPSEGSSDDENAAEPAMGVIDQNSSAARSLAPPTTISLETSEENFSARPLVPARILRSVTSATPNTSGIESGTETQEGVYDLVNITEPSNIQWRHSRCNDRIADALFAPVEESISEVKSEYEYFQKYLPPKFFEDFSYFTNLYSVQEGTNFQPTNAGEIRKLFALHCMMGILKFPRISMFWERGTALPIFSSNMTRNRFYALRTHLHLVDTHLAPNNNDKFYRVRPIMNAIRKRLLEHQLEETLCVDEQIIPFKGRLGMKQYIRGKPCPWGIKLYILCGKSGMPYDFIVYQGSSFEIEPALLDKCGFSASIVLELLKRVPAEAIGHKLYPDNFFTTYSMLEILEKRKILAAGTIRVNRFRNPPLSSDAAMRKRGRGFAEQVMSRDGKILVTKWYDNKAVHLASNFVGIGVRDTVQRYEKKESRFIEIQRPEVVRMYNSGMGGVDLLDQMLQYYRIFIKSKKWTLRVIMHFFDFAIVASYFEYKSDANKNNVPQNDQMDLLAFRKGLAYTLVAVSTPAQNTNKRGRSSNSAEVNLSTSQNDDQQSTKRLKYFNKPPSNTRYDQVGHLPKFDSSQSNAVRCKRDGCKQKTYFYCVKCNAHLCIRRDSQCFFEYHQK